MPPRIDPPVRPLSPFEAMRAAKNNVLGIIPSLAYVQPMLSGRLGSRWHMVQDPGALKRIFLDNVENYPKSEIMLRMLRPAVGDSLFTLEGEAWRWQRRAVAPVFAQRNVVALAPMMTATAERAVERLRAAGEAPEILGEMLSATFDVICNVALSGRDHFDAETYSAAIIRYFETVGRASVLDFLHVPYWFPRPGAILGQSSVKTMHAMVGQAIEDRRRNGQTGADDLLDYMLKAEDPETGRRMSPQDLVHNMQFFIVAGHDTTALTLAWALLLLAGDQDAQGRARAEAQSVLGESAAGAEHLGDMPYARQILEETLRLYPPVGLLARNVRERDLLAGREILPNDTLFLPLYALHRHRMWWDDPDRFDPDNFAPEKTSARDRYLHLPFGAGPRICVGANFAMMQAQIILGMLLARFRFHLADAPMPVPTMTMTVRPEGGVSLKVETL